MTYVLLVHVVAVAAVAWPRGVERLHVWVRGTPAAYGRYEGMVEAQRVALRCTQGRPVLFLGDSLIEGLQVESTCGGPVLNFGIGGDTTTGLLWRLPQYREISRARAICVAIGVNDLAHRDEQQIIDNYGMILRQLRQLVGARVPVVVGAVLPIREGAFAQPNATLLNGRKITNQRIGSLNVALKSLCANSNVTFLDRCDLLVDETGNLRAEFTRDGIHLNDEGQRVFAGIWRQGLESVLAGPAAGTAGRNTG